MTTSTKILNKDCFIAVRTAAENGADFGDISADDIITFCDKQIASLDKRAETARARAAEKKAQSDALQDVIREVLTANFQTIADITSQIEGDDVSAAKVGYRLRKLVEAGVAVKQEISVPDSSGKARKLMAYCLAD